MIRRPPRSTRVRSSAASDVYKRQHIRRGADPEMRQRLEVVQDLLESTYSEGNPEEYPEEQYYQFLYDNIEDLIEILKEAGKPDGKVFTTKPFNFYIKTDIEILTGSLIKAARN